MNIYIHIYKQTVAHNCVWGGENKMRVIVIRCKLSRHMYSIYVKDACGVSGYNYYVTVEKNR